MLCKYHIVTKTDLRFKKLKAKVNPTLKSNVNPDKAATEIQNK